MPNAMRSRAGDVHLVRSRATSTTTASIEHRVLPSEEWVGVQSFFALSGPIHVDIIEEPDGALLITVLNGDELRMYRNRFLGEPTWAWEGVLP
jgi:hypothetical protein